MDAYESMVRQTSSPWAPWVVVPADHKWFARLVVVRTVIEALEELDLKFPALDKAGLRDLAAAKATLEAE
jgi:hypothetical protein